MRQFLTIVMLGAAVWVAFKANTWFRKSMQEAREKVDGPSPVASGKLPGLPPDLEASLEAAKRGGADGLRTWLRQHRNQVEDPRLAEIDLDYIVLVGRSNPAEAKSVLAAVMQRLAKDSPVYKRAQQLEKAYQ